MPSLKKTVRGIFRQFSLNVHTGSTSATSQSVEENDELMRGSTALTLPLRNQWPVNDVIGDYHQAFTSTLPAMVKNGHSAQSSKNQKARNSRGYSSVNTLDGHRRGRYNGMAVDANFIHMYLTGRLKKRSHPEIYYGKTGVDLPVLQIVPLEPTIVAAQSGPAGGLTQVPCVNKRPIVKIANLDDELNLSFESDIDTLSARSCSRSAITSPSRNSRPTSSWQNGSESNKNGSPIAITDWDSPHERAHGLSASLYERHPFTHLRAGDPVADVFAICARTNSCILALADGVNWGEKSRLAARCAIRGAVDYLNEALYNKQTSIASTSDVFRCLLRAFHAGHQLILQEGGSLTTLCIVVVCQLKDCPNWVVCSCNVGDSLAFVYSERYGVREVTLGSHDIQQMRDMRDAGGALGPVDGVNPELHNFTCAMTLVEKDDFIFLTSDGVSDNFDPVVGKFCVIQEDVDLITGFSPLNPKQSSGEGEGQKSSEGATPPKSGLTCIKSPISARRADAAPLIASARKTSSLRAPSGPLAWEFSHLPVVEAYQRHELMLLRMEYTLRRRASRSAGASSKTSRDLCENLLNFAMELTTAKRGLLEDPDLYRCENARNAQKDEKQRRRYIRQRIAGIPGKLDHATVVAYKVGEEKLPSDNQSLGHGGESETSTLREENESVTHSFIQDQTSTRSGSDADGVSARSVSGSSINSVPVCTRSDELILQEVQENPGETSSHEVQHGTTVLSIPTHCQTVGEIIAESSEAEKVNLEDQAQLFAQEDTSQKVALASPELFSEGLLVSDPAFEPLVVLDGDSLNESLANIREDVQESTDIQVANGHIVLDGSTDDSQPQTASFHLQSDLSKRPETTEINGECVESVICDSDAAVEKSLEPETRSKPAFRSPELRARRMEVHDSYYLATSGACEQEPNDKNEEEHPVQTELEPPAAVSSVAEIAGDIEAGEKSAANVDELPRPESHMVSINAIAPDVESQEAIQSGTESHGIVYTETSETEAPKDTSVVQPDQKEASPSSASSAQPKKVDDIPISSCLITAETANPEPEPEMSPVSPSVHFIKPGTGLRSSMRSPELRTRRMQMNDSYYIATSPSGDFSFPKPTATTVGHSKLQPTASADRAVASGRFGKLSKAFDRIERVVKRKHRRGSPNRHTVGVDPVHLAEARGKCETMPGNRYSLALPNGNTQKAPDCPLSPIPSIPSTSPSPSPRRNPIFRWSPMKVFRTFTLRGSDYEGRHKGSQTARSSGKDAAVSRIVNHHRSSLSDVIPFPHSASDTQIVQLGN